MTTAIKDKLQSAKLQVSFVEDSLNELVVNPKDIKLRRKALANIIVFGRTVTFTLQNLKSIVGEKEFVTWYEPFQNEMRNDELLNAFKDARNNLEKQGQLQSKSAMYVSSFNPGMLQKFQKDKPKNAKGFFMGDAFGGSGWIIEMPDGTTEKLYVDLDLGEEVIMKVFFLTPPVHHLGQLVEDTSLENCSKLFFNYLKNIVNSAIKEFLK